LSLRKHQRRLALKAGGHAPGASAVSGHACRTKAAIAPACASDDLPTPEFPSRTGSLSGASAKHPDHLGETLERSLSVITENCRRLRNSRTAAAPSRLIAAAPGPTRANFAPGPFRRRDLPHPALEGGRLAWLTTETLERSLSVITENCRRLRTAEQLLHRVV